MAKNFFSCLTVSATSAATIFASGILRHGHGIAAALAKKYGEREQHSLS